jgi:hypothetical protein
MSFWAKVFFGQMSFWANVLLVERVLGKCLSWANVFLGKRLMGKRLRGKCLSGQMSLWANDFCANILRANVVLANVVSPLKKVVRFVGHTFCKTGEILRVLFPPIVFLVRTTGHLQDTLVLLVTFCQHANPGCKIILIDM